MGRIFTTKRWKVLLYRLKPSDYFDNRDTIKVADKFLRRDQGWKMNRRHQESTGSVAVVTIHQVLKGD
jgi:hypothetical protein